jgi:hypothetical protein
MKDARSSLSVAFLGFLYHRVAWLIGLNIEGQLDLWETGQLPHLHFFLFPPLSTVLKNYKQEMVNLVNPRQIQELSYRALQFSQIGIKESVLYISMQISHWMWVIVGRGLTMGKVALFSQCNFLSTFLWQLSQQLENKSFISERGICVVRLSIYHISVFV